MRINFGSFLLSNLKPVVFCTGLFLTLWRSHDCLQKYFHLNLSTKISLVRSFETDLPAIVICPEYFSSYNVSRLASLGVSGVGEFRDGQWKGNSSASEEETFLEVTHTLQHLIESYRIKYKTGAEQSYRSQDEFGSLNPRTIRSKTYGRCYQLKMGNTEENVFFVDIVSKMPIYVFINLPDQFYHEDARSKVQVNTGESLFLEVTYDVLKINNDPLCTKYDENEDYDSCKIQQVQKILEQTLGCSVPFVEKRDGLLCEPEKAGAASKMFTDQIGTQLEACPEPCVKIMTYFGFPFLTRNSKLTGFARLYFKNIVKVTEDFVSYDLLRSVSLPMLRCLSHVSISSMISEIGGYSGLLIGFSMMDLVVILKSFLSLFPTWH